MFVVLSVNEQRRLVNISFVSLFLCSQLASLKIALPWGMKELFSKGRHKLKSKIVLTIDLLDISIGIFRIY